MITTKQLQEKVACSDQVVKFQTEWPEGAKPTLTNCLRAAKLGLDLDWFANNFLSAPVREEYYKATASAREEYYKARASAWEEYDKIITPAWEEYTKAIAPVLYQALKKENNT